jgi:hypothetical protein
VTSAAWVAMPLSNNGQFTATSTSALLRIEFTYAGATGSAKEVLVDDIVLTKIN